ncbi:MAG: hypothetical protein NUV49_00635 [Patescibacteria group bacterium]|nr:hypothetical protein [Patescibacteria group bacterium]
MHQKNLLSFVLRIGLAFSFLYPAIDSFFHPNTWIGFFPAWLVAISPVDILVLGLLFSGLEIVIAASLLFMRDPFYPTMAAVVVLAGIVMFNWSAFDIVFRDISIIGMAIALILLHGQKNRLE